MMPSVFTFSRSDAEICEQLLQVFSGGRGTAREQWSLQAEVDVEALGWDALWKLSKEFCKKFEVRFPCIAYVTVNSVDFENLTAAVEVLSVQHETVSLPEFVSEVPLIELWPTLEQREKCVNAASTAEFIDLLRFYYEDIWMPWDDVDDKDFLPNTIEERMSLWSELHNRSIPGCVARSITLLRSSAINAHNELKCLDTYLCESGLADEDDSLLSPNYLSKCAEMNARLDGLMSKWTLYENPVTREQYLAKAKSRWLKHKSKKNVIALWHGGSMFEFEEIFKFIKAKVNNDQTLTVMVSAEEALALEPEEVVICSTEYELPEMPLSHISLCSYKGTTLKASEMRSCLLMLSEECRLHSLTLHCALVTTAVLAQAGSLHLVDCTFLDDSNTSQSDFVQGLVAKPGAKILMENCKFDNFYSGIVVNKGAQVELRNCAVRNCGVGIQMFSGSQVKLTATVIEGCAEQCIRCELDSNIDTKDRMDGLHILSNCKIGTGEKEDILIVQQDGNLIQYKPPVQYLAVAANLKQF
ncbi:hypothetical protein ACJJTC_008323 [Scirpophaga incertulas]